ncbi:MAG: tRNA 4-thiouridine(8) synthase ThiI [Atopobiaceae bacterium]|nr:tRNA 4-thiouridine(8) synthase ThiI [Atopobiaceae bacterium]
MERVCLVHYHEIGLKGKNRSTFERMLIKNLRCLLARFSGIEITRLTGYILVSMSDETQIHDVAQSISRVPGVARVSSAYMCERDEQQYCDCAVRALSEVEDFQTFKVHAKKSNTDYPISSIEMNRICGSACCEAFPDKTVKMHNPDVVVQVLVAQARCYVYADSKVGVGGLPVGTAGKVVSLLSSGIDSPVATWMVGRRGATVIGVHFSGRPMTSDESEYLTQDIVEALEPSGTIGRLYVVPFGACQRQISLVAEPKLRVIIYRRLMICVAQAVAEIEGAKALITGESLGQVASQTLDNIAATNELAHIPVLRPLIGSDKQEIIKRAEELGTFEISSKTAPDCCTLFMPRRPETHAKLDEVHESWERLDIDAMVAELLSTIEYRDFSSCPSYRPPKRWKHFHKTLCVAKSEEER